jgi:hypothetical protein
MSCNNFGGYMKKSQKKLLILFCFLLAGILIFNILKVRKLEQYIINENKNEISSLLALLQQNNEIFSSWEETGNISYSELSQIGYKYLTASIKIDSLYRQVGHFIEDENFDEKNRYAVQKYFNNISMIISMDIFNDVGNSYPNINNETIYELTLEEEEVLLNISNICKEIDVLIISSDLIGNESYGRAYRIDTGKKYGLSTLILLVDNIAEILLKYEIESSY